MKTIAIYTTLFPDTKVRHLLDGRIIMTNDAVADPVIVDVDGTASYLNWPPRDGATLQ